MFKMLKFGHFTHNETPMITHMKTRFELAIETSTNHGCLDSFFEDPKEPPERTTAFRPTFERRQEVKR
jgi:hypothetical protein